MAGRSQDKETRKVLARVMPWGVSARVAKCKKCEALASRLKTYLNMKKLASLVLPGACLALFLAMAATGSAATITVSATMNWSALTGGSQLGGQPTPSDTVIVNNNAILTVDVANATCGNLQLGDSTNPSGNGTLVFNSGSSLLVDNAVFPPSGTLSIGVSGGGMGGINMSNGGRLGADIILAGNAGTWVPAPTATGATVALGSCTLSPAVHSFFSTFNNLVIAGGDTSSPADGTVLGGPVIVRGNLEVLGYCQLNDSGNYPIYVAGNVSFDGQDGGGKPNFNPGGGTLILDGSSAQTITNLDSASPFYNVTISNSNGGVSWVGSANIGNTLTLAGGILTMSGNTLVIGSAGSVAGGSASSYVNGSVQKMFVAGNNQGFTFPIGDAVDFGPINLTSLNVTTAGSLTATTTAGQHPQIASSGITTNADVNRYWTLLNSPAGIAVSSYNAAFDYPASDLESGAVPSSFIVRQWEGSTPWANIVLGATATTNATSVIVSNGSFEDFAIGDPAVMLVSSQNPSPLGGAVTFTATVGGTPTATGTVVFMDGNNTLGVGTLNASGVANFSTAALAATNSPHSITAVYGGDSHHGSNVSGYVFQTVTPPAIVPITNASFEADALLDGANNNSITGWIGITPPGTDFGTFNPTDATYSNTSLNTPGNSAGDIPSPGDGVNAAFLSGASIYQVLTTVLTPNTTYTLTGALGQRLPNTGGSGGAAPCSAELLVTNGDVLAGGTNNFVISEPTPGTFDGWSLTYISPASNADIGQTLTIELISSGGGFSSGGQAAFDNIQLTAGGLTTTTTLAPSQNPAGTGWVLTLTAAVNSPAGTGTPTNGMVTFMEGTTTLGVSALNSSGVATLATTAVPLGTNTIMAIYGGSGIYGGSISTNLSEVIFSSTNVTTMTVTSSTGGTSTVGQGVTFSAIVSGSDGGGTVAFYLDGSTTPIAGCSAIPLTSGVAATPTISSLTRGLHSISAVYSGDASSPTCNGSLSGGQTVILANQTITFGSLSNQTYGVAPYPITATASSGLPVTLSVISGPASIISNTITVTGSGTVSVQASQAGNYQYNAATPVTNSFIVNPLAVVLSGTRPYDGTASAVFGILTVTNAVGVDNVTVTSGTATLAGKNVGQEAITSAGSLVLGGTSASNYTLAGFGGFVTITKVPLSVTANAQNTTYGALVTLVGSTQFTSGGLQTGDSIGSVTLTIGGYTTTNSPVGTYTITPSAATGGTFNPSNYNNIIYNTNTLTINPLPVALSGTRPFDGTVIAASSILSIVNDLDGTSLTLSGSSTLASSNVGVQSITSFAGLALGGSEATNYTLANASGSVTITTAVPPENLFEADFGSGNIYEFLTNGTKSTFASNLSGPIGLACNNAGDLFEADFGSGNIYEFTPYGTKSTFASGLNLPWGLAVNSASNLFEADFETGRIFEFTPNGTKSTFASGLANPAGLAFNSAGILFEADYGSGSIYEFSTNGARTTFASGLGNPSGLAINSAGVLFVSDERGNIYEFATNGAKITFASGLSPSGLSFNGAGILFEADSDSGSIYEFTPAGAISTYASGESFPTALAFQPPVTINSSAANAFPITSASLDPKGGFLVVCWQSVPSLIYYVLTNNTISPQVWAVAAGPITATDISTCYMVPVTRTNIFVRIEHQ